MTSRNVPVQVSRSSRQESLMAEIHLAHADLVLAHTLDAAPDVTVEPEYQTAVDDRRLLYFSAHGDGFEPFEAALADDPSVTDVMCTDVFTNRRVYRADLVEDVVLLGPPLADLGVRIVDLYSDDRGWVARIRLPSRDALVSFRDFCRDRDISFSLRQLYDADRADSGYEAGLARDQRELLRVAYEEGYYEIPRGISQNELAEELGISPSAVSQRLRRATGELVGRTTASDRPESARRDD